MKRVAKHAGQFNIVIEEAEVPKIGPTEVLIRAERSLISRGSELWRRYIREEAIDPRIMGYSLAGQVTEVGAQVKQFKAGDRVLISCISACGRCAPCPLTNTTHTRRTES